MAAHLQRQLLHVGHQPGDVRRRLAGAGIGDRSAVGPKQFRVRNLNGLPAARFNRKDADLEKISAGVLEQRGIAHFSNDVLVNTTRLVGREQLRIDAFAADFHAEFVDVRPFRDREHIKTFQPLVVRIVELLVDRCDGDLAINLDVDLVTRDFERGEREMGRRNVNRTLDNNETISAGLRDASEEEEPDRQHQIFVHGALVGNSGKMLPLYRKHYF